MFSDVILNILSADQTGFQIHITACTRPTRYRLCGHTAGDCPRWINDDDDGGTLSTPPHPQPIRPNVVTSAAFQIETITVAYAVARTDVVSTRGQPSNRYGRRFYSPRKTATSNDIYKIFYTVSECPTHGGRHLAARRQPRGHVSFSTGKPVFLSTFYKYLFFVVPSSSTTFFFRSRRRRDDSSLTVRF